MGRSAAVSTSSKGTTEATSGPSIESKETFGRPNEEGVLNPGTNPTNRDKTTPNGRSTADSDNSTRIPPATSGASGTNRAESTTKERSTAGSGSSSEAPAEAATSAGAMGTNRAEAITTGRSAPASSSSSSSSSVLSQGE
ncbi:uncharacterized protein ACOB8E_002041 [Sarcophilus harrisii]